MSLISSKQLSPIEGLPLEILGKILEQLSIVTGSMGILNEADIPVTMMYLHNLASTSTTMHAAVHSNDVTRMFFRSLARKYSNTPEYFAVKLNTTAARVFLWEHIKTHGYDETYNVIQDIYSLASNILREAKEAGLNFNYSEGGLGCSSPNPYYSQTEQGFLLHCEEGNRYIATPFGKISLVSERSYSGHSPFSVSELLIKRLYATFESIPAQSSDSIYEIAAPSAESDKIRKIDRAELKQIPIENLQHKQGSRNLIVNSRSGCSSVYKIHQLGEKILPEATYHASENTKRSGELVKVMWEMLERHRMGKDPISKDIENMSKALQHISVDKAATSNEPPCLKSASEIVSWAMDLIKTLSEQPDFQGESPIFDNTPLKVLVLKRYQEAGQLELLNKAAQVFLNKDAYWNIFAFGGGYRLTLKGRDIGDGLQLRHNDHSCTLNDLKQAFEAVIHAVSLNWELSSLRDYPNIVHTQSEETHILFIKKTSPFPNKESGLIYLLSNRLGVSKFVYCYNYWKTEETASTRFPYLWIRKDKLEEVIKTLGLKVS